MGRALHIINVHDSRVCEGELEIKKIKENRKKSSFKFMLVMIKVVLPQKFAMEVCLERVLFFFYFKIQNDLSMSHLFPLDYMMTVRPLYQTISL